MGYIVASRQGLAGLVASSAKFRTLVGAGSEAAALPFIHYPYPEEADNRPWAIIDNGEGTDAQDQIRLSANGSLALTIEIPITAYSAASGDQAKWLAFATDMDTIYDQLIANSNKAKGDGTNYWNLTAIEQLQQPYVPLEQNTDPNDLYCSIVWLCRWV